MIGGVALKDNKVIRFIEESNKLPLIPPKISEILDMLLKPETFNIDELTKKVSMYGNLEEMILNYFNLVNLNANRKINSLKEAIVYLGAQNVKSIIISFITKLLLPNSKGNSKVFNSSQYWNHCIGTSVASLMICEKTKNADKYKMFSYGLIHDVGITILDICLPDFLDRIYRLQLKGFRQIVAERMILGGLTHSDIGVWLCEKWDLPNDFIGIIGFHHAPLLATSNSNEIKITHLADAISTNYYEDLLGIGGNHPYSEEVIKSIGVTQENINEIQERLPEAVEVFRKLIDFHTKLF